MSSNIFFFFFFQAEDGIRDAQESRGLGDVYKRQREEIAANAGVVLRSHVQYSAGCHSGVNRVSTLLKDVESRLCRQRIARRDNPMARDDLRSSLGEPALRAGSCNCRN